MYDAILTLPYPAPSPPTSVLLPTTRCLTRPTWVLQVQRGDGQLQEYLLHYLGRGGARPLAKVGRNEGKEEGG
jgi:hypothetical protein